MRGEVFSSPFIPFAYELGRRRSTGVLAAGSANHPLFVREGAVIVSELDVLGRRATAELARMAALEQPLWTFRPGPVDASGRLLPLAQWARQHVEAGLDMESAARLSRELAGARVCLRPGHAGDLGGLDDADRRLVIALARPRELCELASLARMSRFRLLAFLHFAQSIGALTRCARLPLAIPPG